ncbi:hypothetical protein [Streptacidiphilus sp. PAMC 29251]
MTSREFGVQLHELTEVQHGWRSVSERMAEMSKDLGRIRTVLARAAATDLRAGPLAGSPGFGAALAVAREVKQIESQVASLLATKVRLTEDIAQDAGKIKAVVAEYQAIDHEVAEGLRKITPESAGGGSTALAGWGSATAGGGGGGGSGGGSNGGGYSGGGSSNSGYSGGSSSGVGYAGGGYSGGGSSGGGGGAGGGGILKDGGVGDWQTQTDSRGWDGWSSGGRQHPRNGEGGGVVDEPRLDGVSAERRGIVDRALERAQHRLGYSQSSVTNGYRVDCSGLVSDAWGLPGPGLDTYGLMSPDVSHRISKDDLQPGDAMIAGDHTLIFGGWADAAHTQYIGIEDSGSQGCISHVIPYPYYSGSGPYYPYRRNGVG